MDDGEVIRPETALRKYELTEERVIVAPIVITERGSIAVLDSERDIPGTFAFPTDQWCVEAEITVKPLRRKEKKR